MIVSEFHALTAKVLAHKGCGWYVERAMGLPHFFSCPRCNALVHENNVEWRDLPVVA